MSSLSTKVRLYCEANSKVADFGPEGNIFLQDDSDGNGPYIKTWSVDGLDKPTDDDLKSHEAEADKFEANAKIDSKRRQAYGSWDDQLDEIYHDIEAWKTRIAGVKSDNPKE